MVGFGQTICLPRVPKCGECRLADENICPFAKKGLKMWKEREAKKITVKEERVTKVETKSGEIKVEEEVAIKSETKSLQEETIVTKGETSPLKPVKKENISGYHIEHFS